MSESTRSRVRELIHRGNVRHVVVEKEGQRAVDLPLTVVIVAAVLAIWAVGILLILALAGGYTIHIEDHEAEPLPETRQTGVDGPAVETQPGS